MTLFIRFLHLNEKIILEARLEKVNLKEVCCTD
jgi:hypothetical protein